MSGAEMFFDAHELLALALIAVNGRPVAEARHAMRRIIASAPFGTDVALALSPAMATAVDQARRAGTPRGPEPENG